MILSFNNFMDCVLLICKNSTLSKTTKINEIKRHITSNNDYMLISIKCDENYLIDLWLGLSKNTETKNEKFYTICGLNTEYSILYNRLGGISETSIQLFNKGINSLNAFCVGVEFLKSEVELCLK